MRLHHGRRVLLPVMVTTVVIMTDGCGRERAEGSVSAIVRDSAGVRIVESPGRAWSRGQQWHVEAIPTLRIGRVEGDPAYEFHRIRAVDVLPDGGFVVLDGGSTELRRYDANGRHEWSSGGPGSGPGEFQQPWYVGRQPDGSFVLWDRALARLTVIGARGEILSSETHLPASGDPPNPYGVFADGALLVTFPKSVVPPAAGVVFTDTVQLWRYDPATRDRHLLARLPGPTWLWTGQHQLLVPFTANPLRALDGQRLITANGPVPEVQIRDPGGVLLARYLLQRQAVATTADDVRDMIEAWAERGFYGASIAVWNEWLDRMPVPAHRPAFDRLLVDTTGNIWLRRFMNDFDPGAEPTWDVVRSDGVYLGMVATPADLEVMALDDRVLAGVFRDEHDVEYVHAYTISAGEM